MKISHSIALSALLILASSCGKRSEHNEAFSGGVIENGVFRHDSIGVTLDIPHGWYSADYSSIKKAQRAGAERSGMSPEEVARVTSDIDGVYPLLAISKYPLHPISDERYNPSISIRAISKNCLFAAGILTLEQHIDSFSTLSPPHYLVERATTVECGNMNGVHMRLECCYPEFTISQDIFAIENAHYIIDAVISTIVPADREILMSALNTIRLN